MALPANPLLTRSGVLGVAVETTLGTSALSSVTAPLNALISDISLVPTDFLAGGERIPDSRFMGRQPSAPAKRMAKLKFRHEVTHGDGVLTLLRGCNFSASGVAQSASTSWTGLSFKVWQGHDGTNGDILQMIGAMGTVTFTFSAGGGLVADWDFDGVWQAPASGGMPTDPTFPVVRYQRASTCTLGGAAIPNWASLVVNVGNDVQMRDTGTVAGGLHHAYVAQRSPTITFDTEANLIADYSPFASYLAGTEQALQVVLTDETNTLTIDCASTQITQVPSGDRGGRRTRSLELQGVNVSGNDDIKFTFA